MCVLTIRPAVPADAGALKATCWPDKSMEAIRQRLEDLVRRRRHQAAWGVVALADDMLIGFGQLARWGGGGEISDLVVSESWRGRGVGTALIEHLLGVACQQGLPDVEIGAAESNQRALALYRRLGFQDRRHLRLDLGNGPEPVVYLGKRLNKADCPAHDQGDTP